MAPDRRDTVDDHVARWAQHWADDPRFNAEVEGATTRMQAIMRRLRQMDAAVFADSDFSLEDNATLHALMVQPYPTEATPAQLAEASRVTRAAMTSRLDRLADAQLITREVDPLDRRRVIVRPTAAGRRRWEHYVHQGMAREQQLLQALSQRELVQLNTLLRKVILSFDQ